jgi:hypothetical protein
MSASKGATYSNVIDEMFPDASGGIMMDLDEPISSNTFGMEIATATDKIIHTDFYNS